MNANNVPTKREIFALEIFKGLVTGRKVISKATENQLMNKAADLANRFINKLGE